MGKLSIIGFGPGDAENMTALCTNRLRACDIIVGYSGYTKLLRPIFPKKKYHDTGMTRERERCQWAIDQAVAGSDVCVVSSGDSGVYGMASLVFELAQDLPELNIEVIPGVTAAISGAALLGAPIGHDFALISLSDLLTEQGTIEKRLRAAAMGDFAICLYNPGSKHRTGHLQAACEILLETLPGDRLCGIAQSIGRDGEQMTLLTLAELSGRQAQMSETVFIGNSKTRNINGRMVTPRGYIDG